MTDLTTVQVKELPPNAISLTDNFPHEVGDVLSRATIQELVDFIQIRVTARQYEVKFVRAPNNAYITDNFNMAIGATQGIGKAGGLWEGWAICNGNNGTDNLDGQTLIGYGATYPTVGDFLGEKAHVLTPTELPPHFHPFPMPIDGGGSQGFQSLTHTSNNDQRFETRNTDNSGGGLAHNNMQPSMVILTIMKL